MLLYIRKHCLRALWNLSTYFPKFENHFAIKTVHFQVSLDAGDYFFAQEVFEFAIAASRASRYHLASFEPDFLQIQLQNTCWASPKPDVQHKNALISHLNDRWISKFLGEKFVLLKSSLIHLISHKTGTITSGFEGKKRKYHFLKNRAILWYALSRAVHKNRTSQVRFSPSKPDLIRPKNAYMIVICFLQLLIEPWKPHDRLHGIPGDDQKESRKTPPRGGRKSMQRERHPKSEITLIRKTRTSSSDFALKFTSYFLKTGTTSS